MRDYTELIQQIVATIKANGRGAITGPLLQEQLLSMIDKMAVQTFGGFATPNTTPTSDYTSEHFYFAMEVGSYDAFVEGLELVEGDFYLIYRMPNDEEWTAINLRTYLKGEKGDDGYTPIKGVDYFDGKDGEDGVDGSIMWPSTGIDEEGNLYVEVPEEEDSTNLTIDDDGYLCVKMPDLR